MAQHETSCGQCDQLPIVPDGAKCHPDWVNVDCDEWFHVMRYFLICPTIGKRKNVFVNRVMFFRCFVNRRFENINCPIQNCFHRTWTKVQMRTKQNCFFCKKGKPFDRICWLWC